jgi:hypothetical protein
VQRPEFKPQYQKQLTKHSFVIVVIFVPPPQPRPLFETGCHCTAQGGLKFLGSSDSPTSATQVVKIVHICTYLAHNAFLPTGKMDPDHKQPVQGREETIIGHQGITGVLNYLWMGYKNLYICKNLLKLERVKFTVCKFYFNFYF